VTQSVIAVGSHPVGQSRLARIQEPAQALLSLTHVG